MSTTLAESKKSFKDNNDGLKPLEQEELDKITNSIDSKETNKIILLSFCNYYFYGVGRNHDGTLYAYIESVCPDTGNPLVLIDPSVIIIDDGREYHFYREHIINSYENCFTIGDDHSNNENSTPRDKEHNDPDLNEMGSKLENLDLKYEISDEEFIAICVLLVQLAPFSKSIIESNGTQNPEYNDFFKTISHDVRSKEINPNKNKYDIMKTLESITEKNKSITINDKIFRNSKGRLIEDLKSILKFLSIPIPGHPTLNGKKLGLKHLQFPYEDYENQLLNIIKENLKNPIICEKMSILISLWEKTNGLQDFVDEVNRKF